jgi:hypothetical protein
MRLGYNEVIRLCPAPRPLTQAQVDLAAAWPLWEEACRLRVGLAMGMCHGRCVIVRIVRRDGLGAVERVVVPSGQPADAIRRAWLIAAHRPER